MNQTLDEDALQLVNELRRRKLKIVFAESCTGGLVAATLTKISGVSDCLCGSAVTYSDAAKSDWLGVRAELIRATTSVSASVAEQMAVGVLKRTPEANLAAAVTGHLGPASPPQLDGAVFVAVAIRTAHGLEKHGYQIQLKTTVRVERQFEATKNVICAALSCITLHPEWHLESP